MTLADLELPDELAALGRALGFADADGGINGDFFSKPEDHLGKILTDPEQRAAALELIDRLVDGESNAVTDAAGRRWTPLATADDSPSGVYLVIEEVIEEVGDPARGGGGADTVVVGIGGLVRAAGPPSVDLTVVVPLLEVPTGGPVAVAIGGSFGRLTADVELDLGAILADSPFPVERVVVGLKAPTDGTDPSVAVRLVLPPEGPAGDVTLDSSAGDIGPQVLELLSGLVVAATRDSADAAALRLRSILAMLGLDGDAGIPDLPLEHIVTTGRDALRDWFLELAGSSAAVQTWLGHLAALLDLGPVEGSGTITDPFALCVDRGPARICVKLGTDLSDGTPVLVPSFSVALTAPASAPAPGQAELSATVARVRLAAQPSAVFLPELSASATIGEVGGAANLVDTSIAPVGQVVVDAMRTGVTLDLTQATSDPAGPGLAFVLEALGVTIAADSYQRLDLTSIDAMVSTVGSALDGVVATVLSALGDSAPARALLTLAGLQAPEGTDSVTWPHGIDIGDFFADPLEALRGYHLDVLVAGRWGQLLLEAARLAGAEGTLAVDGAGTGEDPWSVPLFSDAGLGTAALLAWTNDAADGRRLHIGLGIEPVSIPIDDGVDLSLRLRIEAASLRLAGLDGGSTPVDPTALGSAEILLHLGDDLLLELDVISLSAGSITAGVRWAAGDGIQPVLAVVDASIEVAGGASGGLPVPIWDPIARSFGFEGDVPWEVVQQILVQTLAAFENQVVVEVARLLGWVGSTGPIGGSGIRPMLALADLVEDPIPALSRWLHALLTGPQGRAWADEVLGWLSDFALQTAAESDTEITGSGSVADPWRSPLTGDGRLAVVADVGRSGPPIDGIRPELIPGYIEAAVDEEDAELFELSDLAQILAEAAPRFAPLRRTLAGRDSEALFQAMRLQLAGSDGLVPQASAFGFGSTTTAVEVTSHLDLPAQVLLDSHLPGGPGAAGTLFVANDVAGLAPWPGQDDGTVIDLTGAGGDALDLSAVNAGGPWFALLPSGDRTGFSGSARWTDLTDRLRRLVERITSGGPTIAPLAVVAHGPAGHVARLLSQDTGSAITHLLTVGTPHTGADVSWVDAPIEGEALRLAQSLRGLAAEEAGDLPRADQLLRVVGLVADGAPPSVGDDAARFGLAIEDLQPPAGLGPARSGLVTAALAGRLIADDIDLAMAELTIAAINGTPVEAPGLAPDVTDEPQLAVGLAADLVTPSGSAGALRVGVSTRVDLVRVAIQEDQDPIEVTGPRLGVTAVIDSASGWLTGGPGAGRTIGEPRVRAAEIRVTTDIVSGETEVDIDLIDASVFGIDRSLWRLGLSDIAGGVRVLRPEERILLGRAAAGMGPIPATGPVRGFVDLLVGLGLGRIASDGSLELDVDPVERAIVDPGALLAGIAPVEVRRALTSAAATLLGATVVGDRLTATTGPIEIGLDLVGADPGSLAGASFSLSSAGDGLAVAGGLNLDFDLTASAAGVGATIALGAPSGPAGRPMLHIGLDPSGPQPAEVALELRDGLEALPDVVPIFPVVDGAELARLAAVVVPAEIVRMALDKARDEEPSVAALLDALGLGAPDRPLRLPAGLLADPAGWLLGDTVLGLAAGAADPARLRALLAAVAGLLPGTHPVGGVSLPWGLSVTVTETPVAPAGLRVGFDAPFDSGPVRLSGSIGLGFAAAGGVAPTLSSTVELLDGPGGSGLGSLVVALGDAVSAHVEIGSGPGATRIDLLPNASGLGSLASAATAALPIALDALTEVTISGFALGDLVATLGDALGLRAGTAPNRSFSAAELETFATQPVQRLAVAGPGLAAAIGGIVDPFLPGTVTSADEITTVVFPSGVSASLNLSGSMPVVEARAFGLEPIAGVAVGGTIRVSDRLLALAADVAVAVDDFVSTGAVSMLPFAGFSIGPDTPFPSGQAELGLWLSSPSTGDRDGVVIQVPLDGAVRVLCREVTAGAGPDPADDLIVDSADLGACALGLTSRYLLPLAVDIVIGRPEVKALLDRPAHIGGPRIGDLIARAPADEATALLIHEPSADRYRLAANLIDPDDLGALGQRFLSTIFHALTRFAVGFELPGLAPITVGIASAEDGRLGLRITIPDGEEFVLNPGSEVQLSLEVDDTWIFEADGQPEVPDTGGIEFLLLRGSDGSVTIEPLVRVRGLGLRVAKAGNANLLDEGVTIGALAVHGLFEIDAGGGLDTRGGGQIRLERFALPLGSGGDGGNPVAQGLLSDGGDGSGSSDGDRERLAPSFSPSLSVVADDSSTNMQLRAGEGDGPWWLPIQRGFGPLYVDQVGIGRTIEESDGSRRLLDVSFLIDGGASLAGLAVQVDDLSLTIPWDTADRPGTWKVDLAGMAIGYNGGGVSVAGGFSRFTVDGSVEYRGLASVRYSIYGATAIGAYGEFPDGSGDTYSSFFVFAAVNAPIGGPPPFFVTGLGGGMGINRRLLGPPTIDDLADYPLVQALDSNSTLAQDPMQALDAMGTYFPPERGSLWFAAGLEFTSFALVRSVAVLTAEINDGLEVNLLGLSNMTLPVPATPMVQIELALRARFSTEEGLLSIQAQLTDNSWLINEACRLTGGFAFVVWFSGSNAGQFVLTLGGYHPRFNKPAAFPDVPRLGFAWEPGGGVVIKGTSYFALTSSAVMAGGGLEVSYRSGAIWAQLAIGANFLISWDPFHYDIEFFVEVSAGLKWRVCFFVCGTIKLSFSFGVRVHIVGPKLRGTATLDLDVTSVTVSFGPSGSTNDCRFIDWDDFVDKYVLSPPEQPGQSATRQVIAGSVMRGELAAESGTDDPDQAPNGSAARPWQVEPEFGLVLQTRAATNIVRYGAINLTPSAAVRSTRFDLGPMGVVGVDSTFSVTIREGFGGRRDRSPQLRNTLIEGKVPEAMWRVVPCDDAEPSAKLLPSVTGIELDARPFIPRIFIEVQIDRIDEGKIIHPLPLSAERSASRSQGMLGRLRRGADEFRRNIEGADRLLAAAKLIGEGDSSLTETTFRATVLEDWAAPPRVGALSDDLADLDRAAVTAEQTPVVQVIEPPPDPTRIRPRVASVLTIGEASAVAEVVTSVGRTTAARTAAPTLSDVRGGMARSTGAELLMATTSARTVRSTIMAEGLAPGAGVGGGSRERHRRLGLDPGLRVQLNRIEGRLAGNGHRVPPGDALVLDLHPGEAAVAEPDRIVVDAGQRLRLVAVDRGDNVLVDEVAVGRVVDLPTRASRLVVTPVGPAGTTVGWTAATKLVQISPGAWIGPGCVVRGGAPPTRRRAATVDSAVVGAGDGPGRGRLIDSLLDLGTRSVAVILDGVAADGALLEFAVSGGTRAVGRDGLPSAPVLIETEDYSVMVVAIDPLPGRRLDVRVGVAEGQHLTGVVGSTMTAEALAARVAQIGVAGIAPGPVSANTGSGNRITWEAGT